MKANYHTHTARCNHAHGTDEAFVLAAIEGGFDVLGFADHTPWPFRTGYVSGLRMTCDDLPGYIESLRALREKYADRLSIHTGLECEYFPRYHDHLLRMREQGVSYFILGQHYADSEEDTIHAILNCRTDDGVLRYADAVVKGIRTGLYSYIAHPDMFMRPRPDDHFTTACEQAADMICQAAREQGMPLEYNLLGLFRRGEDYQHDGFWRGYPCPTFWQYASKWHNDAIIGVDAHDPEDLTNTELWARAQQTLAELGYNVLDHLDMEG